MDGFADDAKSAGNRLAAALLLALLLAHLLEVAVTVKISLVAQSVVLH